MRLIATIAEHALRIAPRALLLCRDAARLRAPAGWGRNRIGLNGKNFFGLLDIHDKVAS